MLPDLPVLEHEQPTETSDHSREQTIRRVCIEASAQATAAAKTNRALRTKATSTGQHCYDEGDLVDYHRPTTTKDDSGGWNGPFQGSGYHLSGQSRCSSTIRRCKTFTID
eukprot:3042766-Pyramimonas_sp.AAC.1